jgi:hypothetical protein
MFLSASILAAAVSVIPLEGVKCADMTVRADLDAYNVFEGDPIVLTVDFIGNADFGSLHPPELSAAVDSGVWKIDDKSAKTDTYRNARRMTYRIRPVKDGCLEFPALTFSYRHFHTGEKVEVSTSPIPVHSKTTSQVVISGEDDGGIVWPLPDGLLIDLSSSQWGSQTGLTEDQLFAWRKACASTNAAAFKEFDFPEARLNEAACEILAGNWQRALSIYSSLEWEIGQTPAVERGMVAALALKTSNPHAELPMWRQIFRPVLKHSWIGRSLYALGAILVVAGLFFASRFLLKLIVCFVAAIVFAHGAAAQDIFEEMERMQEMMRREMNSMRMNSSGGGSMMSVNGMQMDRPQITAKVSVDKNELVVGETFNLLISLDAPKDCTLSQIRINPSRTIGLSSAGESENLTDETSSVTNRVIKRISIPLRYDVPFKGDVAFTINGMCDRVISSRGFRSSFSTSFGTDAGSIDFDVKLLDGVKTPDDYNGCIGERFTANQRLNSNELETNDVVVAMITVRGSNAFIPENAFVNEQGRDRNTVIYKKLFRATGESKTPDISFSYYSPTKKDFSRVIAKGVPLKYITSKERDAKAIVIDAAKGATKTVLKFAPRESAREIATTSKRSDELKITETNGEWVRVDDGMHAGWVKKKDLK